MFDLVHDLRSSFRSLLRRPLHSIVTVGILTLGLSVSIAVFTYINGFSQPFPGASAERLVRLFGVESENPYQEISYLDFLDYASAEGALEGIAAAQAYYAASVRLEALTEVAFIEAVSGDYFAVLGIEIALGRGLAAGDDSAAADPAAVISRAWWRRLFNEDPSVLGRTIYLNYRPFTVVGVASQEFLGATSDFRPDVWIPFAPFKDRYTGWARLSEDRNVPLVRVYGRLRGGVPAERALAHLTTVAAALDEAYPGRQEPRSLRLEPATWIHPRARIAERPATRLMAAAGGGLLLLVWANVANLLLAVAAGRQHELAVRAALGASPGRLLRQVLAENVLLAGAAGGVALILAWPLASRLGSYFDRPSVWGANVTREVSVDLRVVAFALGISLLTGLAAGLLPAIRASRRNLVGALHARAGDADPSPRRIRGRRLPGVHDLLLSTQVALAVILLVVAGLVLRSFASVSALDPGFSYRSLVGTHVSTSSTNLEVADRERFFRELVERVREEPWVRSATIIDNAPLSFNASAEMRVEGRADPVALIYSKVIPGFFDTMGIPILHGRGFSDTDKAGAPDVAVVNERLARRFFAGGSALGRRLWWRGHGEAGERAFEIVGVAGDAKARDFLAEPEPLVYFPYPQHNYGSGSALVVSTAIDPATSTLLLQRCLREFEPHLAIVNVLPYTEVVRGFLYAHRMNAEMFSALALFGLCLSAIGIFSVMSLSVGRRRREIGIRMAIGARRADVGRLVLARAMAPVALGLVLGLTISLALTRLVRGLLHGVQPADPIALASGTAVIVAAALAAAYVPARRAAAVDPMKALRHE